MKTAKELAVDQTPDACTGYDSLDAAIQRGDVSIDDVRSLIETVVEAAREQRQGRLQDLFAYDWKPEAEDADGSDVDADIIEPITVIDIDTNDHPGRIRVYINDGRIYDGDPETGQEWSLT